jgi:prephenate dehydratase
MAHSQVLKQCQDTLKKNYSDRKLTSGAGNQLDTAKAAEDLVAGELDSNTAILGPGQLADMYDLDIVDRDLQDDPTNETHFLVVKRL